MKSRAFTLIELLVVIAIIGLLSSVVMASLNTARAKARDARRLSDLRTMETVLQMVINDTGKPPSTGGKFKCANCTAVSSVSERDAAFFTSNFVTPGYIASWPRDPSVPAGGFTADDKGYLYYSDGVDYKIMVHGSIEDSFAKHRSLWDPMRDGGNDPCAVDATTLPSNPTWVLYSPGGCGF